MLVQCGKCKTKFFKDLVNGDFCPIEKCMGKISNYKKPKQRFLKALID